MRKLLLILSLASALAGILYAEQNVNALSGGEFQAGRIMDDGVFFNPNTISTGSIQNFLNSKVPVCDTNGTKPYGSGTRADYGTSKGNPPPYICLKDYRQDTPSKAAEVGLCNAHSGGSKTAAQIIYDVAQICGVNPRVLIVLLEKEQSLITDDWPWNVQYRSATGYGCPDTAPCDAEYYGYFNQVYHAARQYKRYSRDATSFRYRAMRDNFIQYNPNVGCGGTNVYIHNQTTAGLYNYTPYQPNAAALSNLYGSGDGCSAYGNRNFWRIFSDWFGSTFTNLYTSNVDWKFEEFDGTTSSVSKASGKYGMGVSTIQEGTTLRTFYRDLTSGDLKHAWADANGWHYETLDGNSTADGRTTDNVGRYVKTAMFNNRLYVAYYNQTKGDIRLATWDPAIPKWTFQTLDGSSIDSSRVNADVGQDIAITPFSQSLQVFYSDVPNGNLRHAWLSGNVWKFENLDGSQNSVSRTESFSGQNVAVTVHGGTLQLFYYDAQRGNLKHAWADTRGWHFEHLDGDSNAVSRTNGNVGLYIGATSYGGTLQLFYQDFDKGNLKHAWADTRGWHFEHLDGDSNAVSRTNGNVGSRPTTFGHDGKLYVFYSNPEQGILRQAWASSGGWSFAEIDGSHAAVSRNGASPLSTFVTVVPYGNNLQAFYFDDYKDVLRHAWGTPK